MTMFWAIVLQIVLIFLNAVFAAAEIAVISLNENKLKKLADDGNKKAKRLISLTSHPTKFLSTIQVAITLAGLLGSAFAADFFAEPLAQAIINAAGIESSAGITAINTVCVIFITIVLAFFNITFGELVPKRVAMKWAERYSLGISGVLKVVSVVFTPLVWLLTVSSNAVLRIFGIKKDEDDNTVTEEDIVLMAEAGSEKGQIDEKESELIQNVFDFKDNTAGEVCTHRKDVDIVFTGENDSQWEKTIYGSRHIYYPVCGKDADDVLGILNTKIYFRLKDKSRKNVMEKAVQQAVFVPENMPANELFYRMKDTKEHVMIVLDEYGGMSGIVTINDLLELLVGDMADKDEKSEYSIEKIADDKWHKGGRGARYGPSRRGKRGLRDLLGLCVLGDELRPRRRRHPRDRFGRTAYRDQKGQLAPHRRDDSHQTVRQRGAVRCPGGRGQGQRLTKNRTKAPLGRGAFSMHSGREKGVGKEGKEAVKPRSARKVQERGGAKPASMSRNPRRRRSAS